MGLFHPVFACFQVSTDAVCYLDKQTGSLTGSMPNVIVQQFKTRSSRDIIDLQCHLEDTVVISYLIFN